MIDVVSRVIGRARLTSGSDVVTVRSGINPSCRFQARGHTGISRARDGINEGPVIRWVLDGLEDPGAVFWDVGAFHGHYAVLAAHRGARVVAFEPVGRSAARIRRHAQMNRVDERVMIKHYGLSNRRRQAWGGYVGADRDAEFGVDAEDDEQPLQLYTADVGVDAWSPDVVKIDVEGHECAVLDGMYETLQTVERVVVEVHDGVEPGDVGDRLDAAGFTWIGPIETDRSQTYLRGMRL